MLLAIFFAGCHRGATGPAQKSPDGTMTLTTAINPSKADSTSYLCVIVEIRDAAGKILHYEVTPASDTQRWSIQWLGNDEVLLKSSDVGNYHIRRQSDGTWKGELSAS
jgi:hypothetical protein